MRIVLLRHGEPDTNLSNMLSAAWFLGYSNNNGEPISSARKRAEAAFLILRRMAEVHGSVMLIGHGIINRLVANRLKMDGWRGPRNPRNRYWEFGIYDYTGRSLSRTNDAKENQNAERW